MSDSLPAKRISFDPTINLGHVITFIGFIFAGFMAWNTLDKRITVVETQRSQQMQIDATQDQRALDSYISLRETLSRLDRSIERIADRLDKTGLK
jgi:flagellar capping protein FliD